MPQPNLASAPNHGQDNANEMMELLRLVGILGLTMVLGISTFFGLGLLAERYLALHGVGIILGLLAGVVLSLYWTYNRIARHLDRFAPNHRNKPPQ